MNRSIEIMKRRIVEILWDNKPSIYIYASIVLDDFKLGWSDIDILCLTKTKISDKQGEQLLNLRQILLSEDKNNLYFRSFEGYKQVGKTFYFIKSLVERFSVSRINVLHNPVISFRPKVFISVTK